MSGWVANTECGPRLGENNLSWFLIGCLRCLALIDGKIKPLQQTFIKCLLCAHTLLSGFHALAYEAATLSGHTLNLQMSALKQRGHYLNRGPTANEGGGLKLSQALGFHCPSGVAPQRCVPCPTPTLPHKSVWVLPTPSGLRQADTRKATSYVTWPSDLGCV